jgi:hypothetical protein
MYQSKPKRYCCGDIVFGFWILDVEVLEVMSSSQFFMQNSKNSILLRISHLSNDASRRVPQASSARFTYPQARTGRRRRRRRTTNKKRIRRQVRGAFSSFSRTPNSRTSYTNLYRTNFVLHSFNHSCI